MTLAARTRFVPAPARMPKRYLPRDVPWLGGAHARLREIGRAVVGAG
jgi:hypothetical protein